MANHDHIVYRLYDRDDRLLYVGAAADWAQRREIHALRDPWFAAVWRVKLDPPAHIPAAAARVRRLIRDGVPLRQGRDVSAPRA